MFLSTVREENVHVGKSGMLVRPESKAVVCIPSPILCQLDPPGAQGERVRGKSCFTFGKFIRKTNFQHRIKKSGHGQLEYVHTSRAEFPTKPAKIMQGKDDHLCK